MAAATGLGVAAAFGDPVPNIAEPPLVDEVTVSDPRVGEPVAPVELIPVDDPVGVIRVKDREVLVSGSGDGLVDAAAAGLIDGTELIRYTASLAPGDVADAVDAAVEVVITDANRQRAHHWRSSQDVVGFTEDGDPTTLDVLERDVADQRLPVFDTEQLENQTVAIQEGPVRATASSYGEPFAYRPEDRAVHAIDGDATTAWVVGDRFDPVGERLFLETEEPVGELTLRQPLGAEAVRHIGSVRIEADGSSIGDVTLDERSFSEAGQTIVLPEPATSLAVVIDSVVVPDLTIGPALAAVGFAEVDVGLGPTVEVVRVPTDVVDPLAESPQTPVSYVFSRLRTRPSDRWRADPEPTMVREFDVPDDRQLLPAVSVRLDQRAADEVLAGLLGIDGPIASTRLTGVASAAGWAVADRDPSTAWITPFSAAVGARLTVPTAGPVRAMTLTQPTGDFSPITGLRLSAGATVVDVAVPPPDEAGRSRIVLPQALVGDEVTLEITSVDARTVIDRRFGEPVTLPAGIAGLSIAAPVEVPAELDTGCRDDLVIVDGAALPLRVRATTAELLAGAAIEATPCGPGGRVTRSDLPAGTHRLTSRAGTGLQVDRVALVEPETAPAPATTPTIEVTAEDRLSRTAQIDGCGDGCWLVLGEGLNDAWSATADGVDLGPPQLVDGGFNGWRIAPSDDPVDVVMQWTAQGPQTIALIISAVGVLGCLALAALDRRSSAAAAVPVARFARGEGPVPDRTRWIAAGVWVVAAAVLVGVGWALLAAIAGGVLIVHLGRPRLAGVVTIGLLVVIGLVVVRVVQREHPFPNAGWPARFEWLHGLGLFAAVTLVVSAFAGDRPGAVAASGADGSPAHPIDAGSQRTAGEDSEQRGERQVEPGLPHNRSGTATSEAKATSTSTVSVAAADARRRRRGRRRRAPSRRGSRRPRCHPGCSPSSPRRRRPDRRGGRPRSHLGRSRRCSGPGGRSAAARGRGPRGRSRSPCAC